MCLKQMHASSCTVEFCSSIVIQLLGQQQRGAVQQWLGQGRLGWSTLLQLLHPLLLKVLLPTTGSSLNDRSCLSAKHTCISN